MFHMKKNKKEKKQAYRLSYDNLAIPEIHTGETDSVPEDSKDTSESTPPITYDTVAIPEIHIHKKQK